MMHNCFATLPTCKYSTAALHCSACCYRQQQGLGLCGVQQVLATHTKVMIKSNFTAKSPQTSTLVGAIFPPEKGIKTHIKRRTCFSKWFKTTFISCPFF
jgi:hypothetical protein